VSIIDSFGEWKPFKKIIFKNKINLIFSNRINIIKLVSPNGYIKSRISYILIFIFNFIPLFKILRNQRPNFLIIHLITSLPLFLFLIFNFRTKLILRVSGLPKLNIIRKFFWFIVARKCFAITTPTIATYNNLRKSKIFDNKRLFLLRDPILDDIKNVNFKKKKIHKYKKYVLSVGRLTKQKNHEFLIRCFFHIVKIHKDINLFIIGDGELKEKLVKLISELKLQESVFLLGYKKNIKKYISNSLCVVSSSLWEDPGFVMIEAASLKKL
jgi:glycosyltransferase involved in cell wall biosynthesis